MPVQEDTIFLRWRAAFDHGEQNMSTHPTLPEDRARLEEITPVLKANMRTDEKHALKARAEFRSHVPLFKAILEPGALRERWSMVE